MFHTWSFLLDKADAEKLGAMTDKLLTKPDAGAGATRPQAASRGKKAAAAKAEPTDEEALARLFI